MLNVRFVGIGQLEAFDACGSIGLQGWPKRIDGQREVMRGKNEQRVATSLLKMC